jgi:hypothetical protein
MNGARRLILLSSIDIRSCYSPLTHLLNITIWLWKTLVNPTAFPC